MYRGSIDSTERYDDKKLLVVDSELLFKIHAPKWWEFWKSPSMEFIDFNRQVMRYISKIERQYDDVLVLFWSDKDYHIEVLTKTLMARYNYLYLENYNNYEMWLKIVRPSTHLTTQERRNLIHTSVMVDEMFLKNFTE